jgi:hypothetical protein
MGQNNPGRIVSATIPQFRRALAAIAMLLALLDVPAFLRIRHGQTGDFTHFWNAAQAMWRGGDIYASGDGRYVIRCLPVR